MIKWSDDVEFLLAAYQPNRQPVQSAMGSLSARLALLLRSGDNCVPAGMVNSSGFPLSSMPDALPAENGLAIGYRGAISTPSC